MRRTPTPLRFLILLPLLAALLVSCAAMQGGGPSIAGVAWIGASEGLDPNAKGLFLARDGRLLLLGETERVGETWSLSDTSLALIVSQGEGQPGKPQVHTVSASGGRMTLTPQRSGVPVVYLAEGAPASLRGTRWTPLWLRGTEKLEQPYGMGAEPFLLFDAQSAKVSGFAGINTFSGPYAREGDIKTTFGPLATTRKAGPGMPWETRFLEALTQADTMVVTTKRLYLFKETLPLAIFQPPRL